VTGVADIVTQIEKSGGCVILERGGKIRIRIPKTCPSASALLQAARTDRSAIQKLLNDRNRPPSMPPGVKLVQWELKNAPVAVESCAVVVDAALFAKTTIEQLRIALRSPGRWVGWSVPQLVDRLAQIGVIVELGRPHSVRGPDANK
jgi:hypothetical protein